MPKVYPSAASLVCSIRVLKVQKRVGCWRRFLTVNPRGIPLKEEAFEAMVRDVFVNK